MVTRRLAASVAAQQRAQTKMRTATVLDILAPSTTEADLATGWQVLLDFGGGEVKQAGVASTYNPIPGDVVTVMMYLNTLFVIDKVAAGATGLEPGGRVAYGYQQTTGTYATAAVSTEIALSTDLTITVPMRTGAAYEVVLYTGYSNAVANQWAMFRLRQNAFNSGIDIGEYFRRPTTIAAAVCGFKGEMLLRNDTGVDFDVVVVPTLTSPSTGAASAFCTAQTRAYIEVTVKGSSKLYPHAAAVTAPPGLT
jgi:hypothetical protein